MRRYGKLLTSQRITDSLLLLLLLPTLPPPTPQLLIFVSVFHSSALSSRFMTVSSVTYSCLQLPSSSPCRSCWWRRLASVAVFFHLLLYPTFTLLLYHVTKTRVSTCVQSIRVFAVVLCLKCSCFLHFLENLYTGTYTLVTLSTQPIFSILDQNHIWKASSLSLSALVIVQVSAQVFPSPNEQWQSQHTCFDLQKLHGHFTPLYINTLPTWTVILLCSALWQPALTRTWLCCTGMYQQFT